MAKGCTDNTYEEARKQRLEENKKRFEDLGISRISKNLTKITSPAKKTPHHLPKLKSKTTDIVEPRRSSRVRNPVPSYRDDVSMDLPPLRKRSRSSSSSWGSYIARPLDEIKEATEEQRIRAWEAAEKLQTKLQSTNPSFIKSMVRSHVYSCFWLGLPSKFCEEHLPKTVYDMVLEDENGSEYEAVYIGKRCGLSGGWRGFALEHKLDDGDALVFELIEAARFKIYIVKAFPDSIEEDEKESLEEEENMRSTKAPKAGSNCESKSKTKKPKQAIEEDEKEILEEEENMRTTKAPKAGSNCESKSKKTKKPKQAIVHETNESASSLEHLPESSIDNEVKQQEVNPAMKTSVSQKKLQNKSKMPATGESKEEAQVESVEPKTNNLVEPRGLNPGKKPKSTNNLVQDAGELKKVEPVEEQSKRVSPKPRKKPAVKLFRKRA